MHALDAMVLLPRARAALDNVSVFNGGAGVLPLMQGCIYLNIRIRGRTRLRGGSQHLMGKILNG